MTNNTRHALDNINEGLASTLDGITKGLAHSLDDLTKGLANTLDDLGKGLIDFLTGLTSDDKEKKPNEGEKKDAYAALKTWQEMEPDDDKRQAVGRAADYIKDHFKSADRDSGQRELIRERVIELPPYIKDMPGYEAVLARQRALVAQEQARQYQGIANAARIEAAEAREEMRGREQQHEARQDPATPGIEKGDPDPYEKAATELEAKPMKEGQEIEGEVVEVVKVDGKNYYVVEQDGERLAVPAGDKLEHEKGDEITASRTKEGFETGEAYGYGR